MLRAILKFFRKNDCGQDLAEYCLITAFVAIVALGIFIHISGGIQSIWGTAGTALATSNSQPASQPSGGAAPATASAPAPSR